MFRIFHKKEAPECQKLKSEQKYQQNELWTQKDGSTIKIQDMDEQHVRNVLNMILRRRRKLLEQAADDFNFFDYNFEDQF